MPRYFETEAARRAQTLRQALKAGVRVVSAPQLFPTPAPLASRMVDLADVQPGQRVLEPSAGTGRILDALPAGCEVVAVEVHHTLAQALRAHAAAPTVHTADFLSLSPATLGYFDAVLMNPPFQFAADIKHIRHAATFLRPGGVLVAICAQGPRQRTAFTVPGWDFAPLPAGTFAQEGTNVSTAIVTHYAKED
jgi:predicted RNA methylase